MRRLMIFGAALAAFAATTLDGSAYAQSALDAIKQRGELRVAGALYRPLISPRPNGEFACRRPSDEPNGLAHDASLTMIFFGGNHCGSVRLKSLAGRLDRVFLLEDADDET